MVKLVLTILALVLWLIRDPLCYLLYPEMRTVAGEWDGSNTLTMNFYSVIILLCVVISLMQTIIPITDYFSYVLLLLCCCDVTDRIAGVYEITTPDRVFVLPACFIIPGIYYALTKR